MMCRESRLSTLMGFRIGTVVVNLGGRCFFCAIHQLLVSVIIVGRPVVPSSSTQSSQERCRRFLAQLSALRKGFRVGRRPPNSSSAQDSGGQSSKGVANLKSKGSLLYRKKEGRQRYPIYKLVFSLLQQQLTHHKRFLSVSHDSPLYTKKGNPWREEMARTKSFAMQYSPVFVLPLHFAPRKQLNSGAYQLQEATVPRKRKPLWFKS